MTERQNLGKVINWLVFQYHEENIVSLQLNGSAHFIIIFYSTKIRLNDKYPLAKIVPY